MATKMAMEGRPGSRDTKIQIDTIQTEVTLFEFQKCVVDHNLTDATDRKLILSKREDFMSLHPKVGAEIQKCIDDLNQFEKEDGDETSLFRSDSDDGSSGQEG
jgi:hypothetical protein